MTNEHGYCPSCGTDLDGGSIWEYFFHETGSEIKADEYASQYGATRDKGQWGREIGIYDLDTDRVKKWKCPECAYEWNR